MKPNPSHIYLALSEIDGEILRDQQGQPIIDTNQKTIHDRANDTGRSFKIVKYRKVGG